MAQKAKEEEYSRAEFFGLTLQKGAQYGKHLAYGLLSPIAAIMGTDDDQWQELPEATSLCSEPKIVYRKGQPVILLRIRDEIKAYQGGCPADKFFLQYLSVQGQFYCAQCQKAYKTSELKPVAVKLEEGKFYLRA